MKSFRFDFTGGVNVVGDKAVLKDQFVTVADNCDLRSGAPRPYRVPQYDHTPPANTTQIFSYRGKWYYSSVDRSYATEYIGGRDRVYFTQYGGIAQKIVDGVHVTLGTNPPKTAPIVGTGATIQTVPSATLIEGGNFGPSRTRSYRIAVETEDGVLPPGSRATVTTPAFVDPNRGTPDVIVDLFDLEEGSYAAKAVSLTWPKVNEAINYWIFAGDGADESLLDKVPGSVFSYTDYGTKSTTGDLATNYSERFPYTYFYTL